MKSTRNLRIDGIRLLKDALDEHAAGVLFVAIHIYAASHLNKAERTALMAAFPIAAPLSEASLPGLCAIGDDEYRVFTCARRVLWHELPAVLHLYAGTEGGRARLRACIQQRLSARAISANEARSILKLSTRVSDAFVEVIRLDLETLAKPRNRRRSR